jgi:hypothetical protein
MADRGQARPESASIATRDPHALSCAIGSEPLAGCCSVVAQFVLGQAPAAETVICPASILLG